MKRRCPHCTKVYETDLERPSGDRRPIQKIFPDAEPYQREQLNIGYCSDKCNDEAISGERSEYTYDERGRRFENGERKLFADPPRENPNPIYCAGRGCSYVFKEDDRAFEVTVGQILFDDVPPPSGTFFEPSETTYHLCPKCMGEDEE